MQISGLFTRAAIRRGSALTYPRCLYRVFAYGNGSLAAAYQNLITASEVLITSVLITLAQQRRRLASRCHAAFHPSFKNDLLHPHGYLRQWRYPCFLYHCNTLCCSNGGRTVHWPISTFFLQFCNIMSIINPVDYCRLIDKAKVEKDEASA